MKTASNKLDKELIFMPNAHFMLHTAKQRTGQGFYTNIIPAMFDLCPNTVQRYSKKPNWSPNKNTLGKLKKAWRDYELWVHPFYPDEVWHPTIGNYRHIRLKGDGDQQLRFLSTINTCATTPTVGTYLNAAINTLKGYFHLDRITLYDLCISDKDRQSHADAAFEAFSEAERIVTQIQVTKEVPKALSKYQSAVTQFSNAKEFELVGLKLDSLTAKLTRESDREIFTKASKGDEKTLDALIEIQDATEQYLSFEPFNIFLLQSQFEIYCMLEKANKITKEDMLSSIDHILKVNASFSCYDKFITERPHLNQYVRENEVLIKEWVNDQSTSAA